MGMSYHLQRLLLNFVFRNIAPASPITVVYIGLFSADPGPSGVSNAPTGQATAELPAANNYSRQSISFAALVAGAEGTASDPGPGPAQNSTVVTFPAAAASWGAVNYWALFDSAVTPAGGFYPPPNGGANGFLIGSGPLAIPKIVGAGDTVSIPASNIIIALS